MWKQNSKTKLHEFTLNGDLKGTIKVDKRKSHERYTLTVNGQTKTYSSKESLDSMKMYLEHTFYKPC